MRKESSAPTIAKGDGFRGRASLRKKLLIISSEADIWWTPYVRNSAGGVHRECKRWLCPCDGMQRVAGDTD